MKLIETVEIYIRYRKSMGEKFYTNELYLKAFSRFLGGDIEITGVSVDKVTAFLYGNTPVTSTWFIKYNALLGFYRYAISRGYVRFSPLPTTIPKRPLPFIPYIYSRTELRHIFAAALVYQKNRSYVEPYVVRIMLILLYGTALRLSEALSLNLADVDLAQSVITVKQTKFYKSRFVPFGTQLSVVICKYVDWRKEKGFSQEGNSPFFYGKVDQPLKKNVMESAFHRILEITGIKRTGGGRYKPRLHDFRSTFAVHRLISWYQEKADVQQLLPWLSTYMGHAYLSSTSVYLTMTNELLQEAGERFETYARGSNE
jgi:integrase/recombinase XerD